MGVRPQRRRIRGVQVKIHGEERNRDDEKRPGGDADAGSVLGEVKRGESPEGKLKEEPRTYDGAILLLASERGKKEGNLPQKKGGKGRLCRKKNRSTLGKSL